MPGSTAVPMNWPHAPTDTTTEVHERCIALAMAVSLLLNEDFPSPIQAIPALGSLG